jgi:hypothetical protein
MFLTISELRSHISDILLEGRLEDLLEGLQKYVNKGYFIHFGEYNKVGINPRSGYDTPLGIYCYPLTQKIYNALVNDKLPFASEMPYIHVIKPKPEANIILLQTMTIDELYSYLHDLGIDRKEIDLELSGDSKHVYGQGPRHRSIGGVFWWFLWKTIKKSRYRKSNVKWNSLFRELEIDGVVDKGSGIIHENEPTQAVFFSLRSIDVVDMFRNIPKGEVAFVNLRRNIDALKPLYDYIETQKNEVYKTEPSMPYKLVNQIVDLIDDDPEIISHPDITKMILNDKRRYNIIKMLWDSDNWLKARESIKKYLKGE